MVKGQKDHFVQCQCGTNSHIVRFTYWPRTKNDPPEMWIHCQLVPHNSFWKRLKLALSYLFRPNKTKVWGFWDETLLDEKEMLELEQFLENCVTNWVFEDK